MNGKLFPASAGNTDVLQRVAFFNRKFNAKIR